MTLSAVDVLLFIAYFAIAVWFGTMLFPKIIEDVQQSIARTSTHAVALELSGLTSLTGAATEDIKIDYDIQDEVVHEVTVKGKLINVIRVDNTKQNFLYSLPFKFAIDDTAVGANFRIFKLNDEYGIEKIG